MFTDISWENYLVVITLLLVSYYTVIGIRFYSRELKHLFSGLQKPHLDLAQKEIFVSSNVSFTASEYQNREAEPFDSGNLPNQQPIDSFPEVDQLISQIQAALAEAAGELFSKEAFLQLLRQILRTHPILNDAPFKATVQNLILSECEKNGTPIRKEEIIELWQEVYR